MDGWMDGCMGGWVGVTHLAILGSEDFARTLIAFEVMCRVSWLKQKNINSTERSKRGM